jgi:hypothetical protein
LPKKARFPPQSTIGQRKMRQTIPKFETTTPLESEVKSDKTAFLAQNLDIFALT